MTKVLSGLLGVDESRFAEAIKRLELSSGEPGVDIRMTSDISVRLHMAMRQLGLDHHDTKGPELYSALIQLVGLHDSFLAKRLGGSDPSDVADMLPRIKKIVDHMKINKNAWVIRHSVAKRLLMEHPPKKLMKQLKHKSVDSMVKRENISEIFTAVRYVESSTWQSGFAIKLKRLMPSDFEVRPIDVILLEPKRWDKVTLNGVSKKGHNILHSKELGVVALAPLPVKKLPGITITTLPLVIHYLNEIRMYSSYFKMHQVSADFGTVMVETLIQDPGSHVVMAGLPVHWRVVHRHFGRSKIDLPEIFQTHIQPEDMTYRRAEEVLYLLEPALKFWHDMDYVAMAGTKAPVSLNLLDVAICYVNQLPYSKRVYNHFRANLWNELMARFLAQRSLQANVLNQLDQSVVESELIMVGDF